MLEFDPQRRAVTLGLPRDEALKDKQEQQILEFVESHPEALEAEILDGVVGRRQNKVSALRSLIGTRIMRQGKGGKTDPYRYSCSPALDSTPGTRTQDGSKGPKTRRKVVVPSVPSKKGTSGNKKPTEIGSRDGGSLISRAIGKPGRRYPDADNPWSPFEEQVAILGVEGGLSRAEAVRRVKATM